MPLIVFVGLPASGKSTRAQQLKKYFCETQQKKVVILSENDIVRDKNEVYCDANKEKEVRSTLKSEMQRLINADDILILDAGNYIKGYRYELYCASKSSKTTQCTLHCDTSSKMAWDWNMQRPISCQFPQPVFDALVMRFEAPDSRNRWDQPLFTIQPEDQLPFNDIVVALFERKAPPPNQSTQSLP